MINYPLSISTWNTTTNEKGFKLFENKEEFLPYVQSMFKIPGKYKLKDTRATWQHAACTFLKNGYYTNAIKDSIAFKDFWIKQERPRMVDGIEINGFYIPPFFYQYLNYNMIQHKRSKKFTFPDVRDTDYHTYLYFMLCFIKGKHAVICKTRQRGFSLKICAILYWRYMWFDKSINTMGASDEKYVKKSWIFLEWFRQHINEHTPFLRGPQQAKKLDWEEFILTKDFKKRGKQSILKGVTFKTSPTNDVGGQQDIFFYEEGGIAPTMIETLGYIRNAIEDGDEVTGFMVVSGSVGQLDHCKDLEILMKKPESENFLAVENVYDDDKFPKEMGLFIPDEWSLGGFIDEDGNSLVEEAVEYIKKRDADAKKNKSAEAYRLYQSQNPSKPSVAFALRKDSRFPTARIERQQDRILAEEKRQPKKVEIFEEEGKIKWKVSNGEEVKYPVDMTQVNKDGVVLMWEAPDTTLVDQNFAYFAGVDTISSDITTTSESLYSIYIFKGGVETTFEEEEVKKVRLESYRMVASWTGRIQSSDGLNKTNKIGELLVRLYKAHTYVERNHPNFIGHMQKKGWTWPKLLKENDVPLLKEMDLKDTSSQYGVYMDNTGKKMDFIIDNVIAYLDDEIDVIFKTGKDGIITEEVAKTVYGVERINDYWLLEEMKLWYPGRNADRLQAFGLGLCAAKSFFQNKIYKKKSEVTNKVITPPKPRIIDPMGSIFRQTKTKRTIYL
jgi:hypothetical protein